MELIRKSVELVNKNMMMLVPFLLQFLLVGGMVFMTVFSGSLLYMSADSSWGDMEGMYMPIIASALVIMVVSLLIQSYVMSGIVGMGKEAMEKGSSTLSDFFSYGKKYYFKVLLIELMGAAVSLIVMIPMYIYLVSNISNFMMMEMLPLEFFGIFLGCGFISAIVYFIAHFSMVPLIKDEMGVWSAIGTSFRILPKGFKDCMVLLGVSVAIMIMFIAVSLVLGFIPVLGQLIVTVIQFYFVVVLMVWTLMFYDKHNNQVDEEKPTF